MENIDTDEVITYEFQISTTEDFTIALIDKTGIAEGTTYTEYRLTGAEGSLLTNGTRYFYRWRVYFNEFTDQPEYSKWNRTGSFVYTPNLQFNYDNTDDDYAPNTWAIISTGAGLNRFEFEMIPYPYKIIPRRFENRNRNLAKDLLIENFAIKYTIEFEGDILGMTAFNELKRFFIQNESFYIIAYIQENRNIWEVRPQSDFLLDLLSQGNEDKFKGKMIFEEV